MAGGPRARVARTARRRWRGRRSGRRPGLRSPARRGLPGAPLADAGRLPRHRAHRGRARSPGLARGTQHRRSVEHHPQARRVRHGAGARRGSRQPPESARARHAQPADRRRRARAARRGAARAARGLLSPARGRRSRLRCRRHHGSRVAAVRSGRGAVVRRPLHADRSRGRGTRFEAAERSDRERLRRPARRRFHGRAADAAEPADRARRPARRSIATAPPPTASSPTGSIS